MEDKMVVPYIVYEGERARNERTTKRLIHALIVALAILFATNAVWLYAWMSYDYSGAETVTVDGEGIANYIGNSGVITNGTDRGGQDAPAAQEKW